MCETVNLSGTRQDPEISTLFLGLLGIACLMSTFYIRTCVLLSADIIIQDYDGPPF